MKRIMFFIKRIFLLSVQQAERRTVASLPPKEKKKEDISCVTERFLNERFDFRLNVLTEVTEFRKKGEHAGCFRIIGPREMNSLCIVARREGVDCWDRDVVRYIQSAEIEPYHPFRQYMDELEEWDGIDRLTALARRVSEHPLWVKGFSRWMLALTAQWMGMNTLHANSVAPILISKKQGMHKSTFCKMLLPESLQDYYTDSFNLNAESGAEQKLTAFGLINLDEIDKFSAQKMTLLKNLIQMAGINIRKAYQKNFRSLPRIASFIGTSNLKEILTDPTGSRRYLCVEVEKKIDCSPIDYEQLYAQLKTMLETGERYWFTSEDEAKIMEHNTAFQKRGMVEELFLRYYRIPHENEEPMFLLASDMFEHLKKQHPSAMRNATPNTFGRTLMSLGIDRIHRKDGNYYRVTHKQKIRKAG